MFASFAIVWCTGSKTPFGTKTFWAYRLMKSRQEQHLFLSRSELRSFTCFLILYGAKQLLRHQTETPCRNCPTEECNSSASPWKYEILPKAAALSPGSHIIQPLSPRLPQGACGPSQRSEYCAAASIKPFWSYWFCSLLAVSITGPSLRS